MKSIWDNYDEEAAALRNAMGITKKPISSEEFLRRDVASAIGRQHAEKTSRKNSAPVPTRNDQHSLGRLEMSVCLISAALIALAVLIMALR